MRFKFIFIFAPILAICGLLSFFIVRASIANVTGNRAEAQAQAQALGGAGAWRLQLDLLARERWLANKAQEPTARDVLTRPTQEARSDAATTLADGILSAAKSATTLGSPPAMVVVVDAAGKVVGRNGSGLSRGDDFVASYPAMKAAIAKGAAGSDVGMPAEKNGQYAVSFAPIRDDAGKVLGAVVLGVAMADQLARLSTAIGNADVVLADDGRIVGTVYGRKDPASQTVLEANAVAQAKSVLGSGQSLVGDFQSIALAAAPLESVADGKRIALLVVAPAKAEGGLDSAPWTVLAVTLLGILMVVVASFMLGTYISKPIDTLEEGLLAIINGQEDKRFNLEHAEFGGLGFRIDQLLNKLAGVQEDETDADGRVVSTSVAAPPFRDVMAERAPAPSVVDVSALLAEAPDAYYARLFAEYIRAKKALGEAVDHITAETFTTRIQSMEQDALQKHGHAVRYRVQSDGQTVTLLAVPLG
jgi:hypothetical protein